jgi:hypothetical protein
MPHPRPSEYGEIHADTSKAEFIRRWEPKMVVKWEESSVVKQEPF